MSNTANYGYNIYIYKKKGVLYKTDFYGIKWELKKIEKKIIPSEYNKYYYDHLMPNQNPYYINGKNQLCRQKYNEEIIYNTDDVEDLN